ncbi:hypothetical protein Clacol_009599 [Clathrus columnatus]|uniref:Uncharacterized protein n=1 Tax=Clathrus columnatus TaxID=1419009 RepID=A0AAV5AQL1_9AGAM|nr:hypothetical protein Clacol_009599 [Clathrus columnatus]
MELKFISKHSSKAFERFTIELKSKSNLPKACIMTPPMTDAKKTLRNLGKESTVNPKETRFYQARVKYIQIPILAPLSCLKKISAIVIAVKTLGAEAPSPRNTLAVKKPPKEGAKVPPIVARTPISPAKR